MTVAIEENTLQNLIPTPLTFDCFEETLSHLIDSPKTLYSCILVNRLWCRTAIPLLWSHPFEVHGFGERSSDIIQTYISCLPEDERQLLIDEGLDLPPSTPLLFDYSKYLQSFDSAFFTGAIMSWLTTRANYRLESDKDEEDPDLYTYTYLVQLIGNLLFSHSKGLRDLDLVHFGDDDDSLITDIATFDDASKALSRLEKFQFDYSAQKGVRELVIVEFWSPYVAEILFNSLICQWKSLTYLRFHQLDKDQFRLLLPILPTLINLETLQFLGFNSENENDDMIKSLLDISNEPINIKHLYYHFIDERLHLDAQNFIIPILQMSNNNLRTLYLDDVTPFLIQQIGINCRYLTHLSLTVTPEIPDLLFSLLISLQNLVHFSLYSNSTECTFSSTDSLIQFSEAIPECLKYFGFKLDFESLILGFFLKQCKAKLQVLAIYRSEFVDAAFLDELIKYAKEVGSLKKIMINWDGVIGGKTDDDTSDDLYYGDDEFENGEDGVRERIEILKTMVNVVYNIVDPSHPFSGPSMEYIDPWNQDITLS
ncbi:2583_t:CDS:2 [Scutellospora calospora]|uniref:2583_t:CDS:1 n=1 Tax=Scutellospora calospora TaxID=85575 RepID=A0ACA9LUQ0_9GLOM|nr:2583_t:CDS:2 [Scutellospora calospora]